MGFDVVATLKTSGVSDLDPEDLRAVGLEQELRRINLRDTRPIYAPWNFIPK